MKYIKTKFVFAHQQASDIYGQLSYCTRLKVGAMIVKGDTPIAIGYNGMPSGEPNVCELADGTTDPRVRHAEVNALRKLIKSNETSEDAIMFVTHAPCQQCAIDIYESGIRIVFFKTEYRDTKGIYDLLQKGVKVYQVDVENQVIFEFTPFGRLSSPVPLDDPIGF